MESGVWQVVSLLRFGLQYYFSPRLLKLNRLVFDALLSPQDVILSQFYRNKMSLCGVAVAAVG